jgi:hypothetical protein
VTSKFNFLFCNKPIWLPPSLKRTKTMENPRSRRFYFETPSSSALAHLYSSKEDMLRNTLRTWGTYWEHKRNIVGTHWEPRENEKKLFPQKKFVTCTNSYYLFICHLHKNPTQIGNCELRATMWWFPTSLVHATNG